MRRYFLIIVSLILSSSILDTALLANPLPSNPSKWICPDAEPGPEQIKKWCNENLNRGTALPANLRVPGRIFDLAKKNAYDIRLTEFLIKREYVKLGWYHDKRWRMTGPYVGKPGSGKSYGVHPAVKIYYSPEIIDWMCSGRKDGKIPDGAMIIKEMHDINDQLALKLSPKDGCMDITAAQDGLDKGFGSWTVMVKDQDGSFDGWYWANPYKSSATGGNPPILDRSAFAKAEDVPTDPTQANPNWYPTGNSAPPKVPIINYPYNGFGVACLNCHVSAQAESTFASLENLMGEGLRYKGYDLVGKAKTLPRISGLGLHVMRKHRRRRTKRLSETEKKQFPSPLSAPDPAFLHTYDQMPGVKFARAWDLRFPAETFDHVVPQKGGGQEFLTSDQCQACHDATYSNSEVPNMMLQQRNGTLINLSIYGEWRVSPMGLAGRDPIFYSQLQSETNNLPQLADCIENTCLRCHGVMGQRQYSRDTPATEETEKCKAIYPVPPSPEVPQGKPFRLDMVTKWQDQGSGHNAKYGALARDGISCMACHQMEADQKGKNYASQGFKALAENEKFYTGNFVTTSKKVIYGPLETRDIVQKPMEHVMGLTPEYGAQIAKSEMCGNCHNILLPEFTNAGENVGASYEQSTHLEWANSVFGKPKSRKFQSCQGCHMPHKYGAKKLKFKIANIESSDFAPTTHRLPDKEIELKTREPFPRHALHGLNVFLNQMFQQFPVILGLRQIDYMTGSAPIPSLKTGQKSMLTMARRETASVRVNRLTKRRNHLRATVTISNKAGHYLPSGVGFRRVFVEFLVQDRRNKTLWASGRTNRLGQILIGITDVPLPSESPLKNPKEWQPHYQVIRRGSQAQIYQEIILDSDGNQTTSFLRRIKHVKDNRIRPQGFDPKFFKRSSSKYIRKLGNLEGPNVRKDKYYSNPRYTGADRIEYRIKLSPREMRRVHHVKVTVYNQSIPPGYLQERFRDAGRGPAKNDEIQRLYYLTSHLNVNSPVDDRGKPFMKDWKLKIAGPAVKRVR